MRTLDAGDTAAPPTDIIDAGDTASPPTDIIISPHLLEAQSVTGVIDPDFEAVDTFEAIERESRLLLVINVGGTSTDVTVDVPGAQPYTGVVRADAVRAGQQNKTLLVHLSDLLFDPISEVASVTYSQTTGVTAALLKGT